MRVAARRIGNVTGNRLQPLDKRAHPLREFLRFKRSRLFGLLGGGKGALMNCWMLVAILSRPTKSPPIFAWPLIRRYRE